MTSTASKVEQTLVTGPKGSLPNQGEDGSPSATASPAWTPRLSWRFDIADADGYSRHGQIEVGDVYRLGTEPAIDRIEQAGGLERVCGDLDPQRDAVMPVRLQLTNTSSGGFDQDISLKLYQTGEYGGGSIGTMRVARVTTEGTRCDVIAPSSDAGYGYQGDPWVTTWSDAKPNELHQTSAYIVLVGLYTPAEPSGSVAVLTNAQLILNGFDQVRMDPSSDSYETGSVQADGTSGFAALQLDGTPFP